MGKPSDKRRSAQRPGRRERTRAKRAFRGESCCFWSTVGGRFNYRVVAGRKKYGKVQHYLDRLGKAHLGGDLLIVKSGAKNKRPLYKFEAVMHNTMQQLLMEGKS